MKIAKIVSKIQMPAANLTYLADNQVRLQNCPVIFEYDTPMNFDFWTPATHSNIEYKDRMTGVFQIYNMFCHEPGLWTRVSSETQALWISCYSGGHNDYSPDYFYIQLADVTHGNKLVNLSYR